MAILKSEHTLKLNDNEYKTIKQIVETLYGCFEDSNNKMFELHDIDDNAINSIYEAM